MSSGSSKRPGGARWENETGCTPGARARQSAAQQKSKIQLRARDLSPRNKATWSRPFAPERAGACKNLQDVPKQASTIDLGRSRRGRAGPDFPGSAAICGDWHRPVTPEAAGSSPVDPANCPSATKRVPVCGGSCLQTGRSPRDASLCRRTRNGVEKRHRFLVVVYGLERSAGLGPISRSPAASCDPNSAGRGTEKFEVDRRTSG